MNKSKGKKAGKICENILFVIGILGIVILYWYDRSITLDPNIKESYTGEYPRYVSEVNEDDIPDEEYYPTMEEAIQKADVYYDEYEPDIHSIVPPSSTIARFVLRLYIFFDQFSIVEYLSFAFFLT